MTPWFGPKSKYDTGIASWQGWVATLVFLAALAANRLWFKPAEFGLPSWSRPASTAAVVVIFLAVVYFTYDRDE
ncbi:MAG TPA: hypothetical protein VHY57_00915 [Rhizomicrobium sp.]|jgi:hypothetical protein|nr:hypothetical protein [Rhizomicrobium sp.]